MPQPTKVLSLLQVIGHPRDSKRIDMLLEAGFEVEAGAFERDYHSGRLPACQVTKLGFLENRKYLKRFFKLLKALWIIRPLIKRNDLVYASGQDMGFIAFIAGLGLGKPIVMEVGDIVHLQLKPGWMGNVIRRLDRMFVNRCAMLVVISPGFKDVYYRNWLKYKKTILVIENKLDDAILQYSSKPAVSNNELQGDVFTQRPFRIGYFGLLRDAWSLEVLTSLCAMYPGKYEVIMAGKRFISDAAFNEITAQPGITYLGEYKSPNDLSGLYNRIDMVWACYAFIGENDWNLKWGRPNRYFESCFFGKPCFARKGAHFADEVQEYQIGKVISETDIRKTIDEILAITAADLQKWQQNLRNLPEEKYIYKHEISWLKSELAKLLEKQD